MRICIMMWIACLTSPSSRRAWIEIRKARRNLSRLTVALLTEGVDRNRTVKHNKKVGGASPSSRRAWIEIPEQKKKAAKWEQSPSSRRAWIEISGKVRRTTPALKSPSSRRAWIEIYVTGEMRSNYQVALLTEGVDRNSQCSHNRRQGTSRPPHGGRG